VIKRQQHRNGCLRQLQEEKDRRAENFIFRSPVFIHGLINPGFFLGFQKPQHPDRVRDTGSQFFQITSSKFVFG